MKNQTLKKINKTIKEDKMAEKILVKTIEFTDDKNNRWSILINEEEHRVLAVFSSNYPLAYKL